MDIVKTLFWVSVAFIIVVIAGYPVILALYNLFRNRQTRKGEFEPIVSVIISAHNEENHIAEKIQNTLGLAYPREKLEIIVASDGSDDQTNNIVEDYVDHGVQLHAYDRMGKTGIQNESVKRASGEIIVFSDANAMYQKDALKMIVRNFLDPHVGCVCGQLIYGDNEKGAGFSEIIYWEYEKYLKRLESRVSSLIGVNGSIYAVRKADYVELDTHLISDLVEPLEIVKRGKRVVYEADAKSYESPSDSFSMEFERKVRILTRSIQGFLHVRGLFNPMRYGFFSIQLLMHKILRYFVPFALIVFLGTSILLSNTQPYYWIFLTTVAALVCSLIAKLNENKSTPLMKIFSLVYYYTIMNQAIVVAWKNVYKKKQYNFWDTKH